MSPGSMWNVIRTAVAALIAVAVFAQAWRTIGAAIIAQRDVATTVVNFLSFFTILSNILTVVVLAAAAIWFFARGRADAAASEPHLLAVALACVTTYMLVTGVVYNVLLRNLPLDQGITVAWSNEVLHVVGPLFLLADLFLGPRRSGLQWAAIAQIVVFPVVWVVYTLIRGPLTTHPLTDEGWWYPYPFLNPHLQEWGYPGVMLYVTAIAIAIGACAALVVWIGRRRDLHSARPATRHSGLDRQVSSLRSQSGGRTGMSCCRA